MIVVRITQTCNGRGCEKVRILKNVKDEETEGWRELRNNVHLCPDCINQAIEEK